MYEAFGVVSVIAVLVLLYLLVMNWQLSSLNKNRSGNRYKCLIFLRFLHITSLIEIVTYLLNTYGAATSATVCGFLNYSITVSKELQLFWVVLAWEIQVRTMTLALQGHRLGILSRIFWVGLPKFMIIIPIFGLVLTLCTWTSNWDLSIEPNCTFALSESKAWVLNTRIALSFIVHGVFFLQFGIQTRQASKMANYLVADLKDISTTEQDRVVERLKSDATACKLKAKSASKRNLIIGANAMLWTGLCYGVIPHMQQLWTSFDTYLDRVALVFGGLTVNCSFYLIFSQWKLYLCLFCKRYRRPTLGDESSESLLMVRRPSGDHFLKRMGEDEEVEYFASPAVIYEARSRSKRKTKSMPSVLSAKRVST